jgi:predicted ArsR family transcriptional regulator
MSKRNNPSTSKDAYKSLTPAQLTETYGGILEALKKINEGTFEQIAQSMKVKPDKVWKRISELMAMGLIYRPGNKRTLKSGRQGYTYMLSEPGKEKVRTTERAIPGKSVGQYAKDILSTQQDRLF